MQQCLTKNQILDYVTGSLSENESYVVEIHAAHCRRCAGELHDLLYIRDHFDELWDAIRVSHMEHLILLKDLVCGMSAEPIDPSLKQRLMIWAGQLHQTTQLLVQLAVDTAKKTAEFITKERPEDSERIPFYMFSPLGQPKRVLGEGDGDRQQIKVINESNMEADIHVSSQGLHVVIYPPDVKPPFPLVCVYQLGKGKTVVKAPYQPDKARYLSVKFTKDEMGEGTLWVLIETPAAASGE